MTKVLASYAYFHSTDMAPLADAAGGADRLMLFGDSGAHSARTLGLHLDIDLLAGWVRQWAHLMSVYANLDVIGAPQATWDNQKRMEAMGLYPLPVYHTGEPLSVLDRYLEDGYRYIALGKLLGNPKPAVLSWLARVFKHVDGQAVFHGFGMTVWEALRDFPFYSVDSSSWSSGYRFGSLKLFDRGSWKTIKLRDKDSIRANYRLIQQHGGEPLALLSAEHYHYRVAARMSAVAYRRAEAYIRRRHHVPLPESPRCPVRRGRTAVPAAGPGPHLYLADANKRTIHLAAAPPPGPHMYLVDGTLPLLQVAAVPPEGVS